MSEDTNTMSAETDELMEEFEELAQGGRRVVMAIVLVVVLVGLVLLRQMLLANRSDDEDENQPLPSVEEAIAQAAGTSA